MCSGNIKHRFQLLLVSLLAFYVLIEYGWYIFIVATIFNIARKRAGVSTFIENLGLASDDIGGTILFWTIRHSISGNVGLRAYDGDRIFIVIARTIDYLFGDNHCYCVAKAEGLLK